VTEIPFVVESEVAAGDAPLQYERPRGGRVRLTVRAGPRRTGGHAIRVTNVRREGPRLIVRCEISAPADGALVTQALTAPAQTVSVDERAVRGVREAVLEDAAGAGLARISA
jgi:hypothetical protein